MKSILPTIFLIIAGFDSKSQSLNGTSWKGYFGEPVKDSLVYSFHHDSCTVTDSEGRVLILSKVSYSKDTLLFNDLSGKYQCGVKGKYAYKLVKGKLQYTLIEDRCPPRTAITKIIWTRSKAGK